MILAKRASLILIGTVLAGCTAARQTLADGTGWLSKKLDPSDPPPKPPAVAPPPPPKPVLVVPPRQLQLAVKAGDLLNPDAARRPAPLVLRVYLLNSEVAFNAADFFSLFERDAATLGAALIAREEIQLRPGRSVAIARDLPPETKLIGVVGAFRNLEQSAWRAVSTLPPPPAATVDPPERPIAIAVRIVVDGGDIAISLG